MVHLLASIPNASYLEYMDWNDDLWVEPVKPGPNGTMTPPERPGHGLAVRPEVLKDHRIGGSRMGALTSAAVAPASDALIAHLPRSLAHGRAAGANALRRHRRWRCLAERAGKNLDSAAVRDSSHALASATVLKILEGRCTEATLRKRLAKPSTASVGGDEGERPRRVEGAGIGAHARAQEHHLRRR